MNVKHSNIMNTLLDILIPRVNIPNILKNLNFNNVNTYNASYCENLMTYDKGQFVLLVHLYEISSSDVKINITIRHIKYCSEQINFGEEEKSQKDCTHSDVHKRTFNMKLSHEFTVCPFSILEMLKNLDVSRMNTGYPSYTKDVRKEETGDRTEDTFYMVHLFDKHTHNDGYPPDLLMDIVFRTTIKSHCNDENISQYQNVRDVHTQTINITQEMFPRTITYIS